MRSFGIIGIGFNIRPSGCCGRNGKIWFDLEDDKAIIVALSECRPKEAPEAITDVLAASERHTPFAVLARNRSLRKSGVLDDRFYHSVVRHDGIPWPMPWLVQRERRPDHGLVLGMPGG